MAEPAPVPLRAVARAAGALVATALLVVPPAAAATTPPDDGGTAAPAEDAPVGDATTDGPAAGDPGTDVAVVPDVPVAGAPEGVSVEVTALRDDPLTPDDELVVGLRVVNGDATAATGLTAELRVQPERLGSRDAVAAWADAPPDASAGEVLLTLPLVEPLAPGTGRDLVASVPADALGLPSRPSSWGPRGLAVDVVDAGGDRLDADRGLLVWQPADETPLPAGEPVATGVVVPLTGAVPDPSSALVPTDDLAALVDGDGPAGAGEGRLGRLLEVARHPAASWALDPLLLDSTAEDRADLGAAAPPAVAGDGDGDGATDPTDVPPATGGTEGGSEDDVDDEAGGPTDGGTDEGTDGGGTATTEDDDVPGGAAAWRERLLATAPDHEVLALPRGDTDLLSVAGAGRPALWAEGRRQARAALDRAGLPVDGARVRDDVVWPAGGVLGDRAADLAADAAGDAADGRPAFLLAPAATGAAGTADAGTDPAATAAAAVLGEGAGEAAGAPALVADGPLSAALAAVGDDPVAGARLLAETAALAREPRADGTAARVLVVAPRDWDVGVADGYAALDALTAAPWTRAAPVAELLEPAAGTPVALDLPATADGTPTPPLDGTALAAASDAVTAALPLAGALGDTAAVDDARLRATAAAALAARTESGWADAVLAVARASVAAASGVSLLQGGQVTVVGAEASVPVTVSNDLDRPVEVVVAGRSGSPRLRVLDDVAASVPAGARTQVLVPVEAVGEGDAVLTLQLSAPGGADLGEPVSVPVRVRLEWAAWGTAGVAAAGGVVLVAGLVRSVRSARRRAPGEGPRSPAPTAGAPPVPHDPDHPRPDGDDAQQQAGARATPPRPAQEAP